MIPLIAYEVGVAKRIVYRGERISINGFSIDIDNGRCGSHWVPSDFGCNPSTTAETHGQRY